MISDDCKTLQGLSIVLKGLPLMITPFLKKGKTPLYEQIYESIRDEIVNGSLTHGEKLPSKRKLALHINVSLNTIDTAYSQLIAEGYIESVPKKGFFVCQIDKYLHSNPIFSGSDVTVMADTPFLNECDDVRTRMETIIDFSPSDIEYSIFPFNSFRKIFKSIYHENNISLLKKGYVQGDIALRRALAGYLYSSRGVKCNENQIIIGAGTDSLLLTLAMVLGRDKVIAFENPVYLKAYHIFYNMGNKVIPIDIDDKGIRMDLLKDLYNTAIYVTPSHHFPLGISMPIDRRIKLLNFANSRNDTYIIEDDYDSEFRYNEKPLPSLQSIDKGKKVIYIGTFSKSIAPSIRLSYMILPEPLLKIYIDRYHETTPSVSVLEQKMIAEFINSGNYEKHINKMRKIYKDKRVYLIKVFGKSSDKIKISGDNAGHHLLVSVSTGMPEEEMCKRALALGIKVYPISPYFIGRITPVHESMVLIGYGSLTYKQIDEGIQLLMQAWEISY